MTEITDDFMRQMISRTSDYCLVILKAGPNRNRAGAERIIWEHGRRHFALRAKGLLAIICLVADGNDISGIGIFDATPEETRRTMDGDAGVREGVFVYEIHACRSFPGDCLPG